MSFLCVLVSLIAFAYSNAKESSSQDNNSTDLLPCSILPAAFILGASVKTSVLIFTGFFCSFKFNNALIPGLGELFIISSPKCAIILFSPVIGTTSAAMLVATKSKYW